MEIIIIQHKIDYWLKDENNNQIEIKLNDCDKIHIENCLKEGNVEGELCSIRLNDSGKEYELRGWWKIN